MAVELIPRQISDILNNFYVISLLCDEQLISQKEQVNEILQRHAQLIYPSTIYIPKQQSYFNFFTNK